MIIKIKIKFLLQKNNFNNYYKKKKKNGKKIIINLFNLISILKKSAQNNLMNKNINMIMIK